MNKREKIDITSLSLPDEVRKWAIDAPVYESSGHSGAKTVYIDCDGGAYLKIAACGSLYNASQMQTYFSNIYMSSSVIFYLSADKDYMITEAIKGEDGISEKYLAEPERLCEVFGRSLRRLHETDLSNCPVRDKMSDLISLAETASFYQEHLDDIADYIGTAKAEKIAEEIKEGRLILKNDVLIHGDYCLPNIMLDNWVFKGFVDVADGGVGDRHYDLAWGLWTLNWNLKSPKYGRLFLDAYGRDKIDKDRLRICGLLSALE